MNLLNKGKKKKNTKNHYSELLILYLQKKAEIS